MLFRHSDKISITQEEHLATSPAARDRNEVVRALNLHTGNGGRIWCLSSNLSLWVGLSIQDKAMGVARSAPQGDHYHEDVIYLLP